MNTNYSMLKKENFCIKIMRQVRVKSVIMLVYNKSKKLEGWKKKKCI